MGSSQSCPRINTTIPENGSQWSLSNGKWDNVKLGWLIAGIATLITMAISMYATYRHARHYHRPKEQRQIIRILWMPLLFAIISFFSYRYYRYYIYYKLVFIVYEALCLMAFLALMLAYIGNSTEEQMAVLQSKDKRPLPWPMGCLRYRPSKPYFLYALNLSVLQYAFLRPLLSIVAMICHAARVLCANKLSPYFAYIYLEVVDFTSISIALYGLVVMYTLVKGSLEGKRPLMKFMLIKVLAFILSALVRQGVIKPNRYWSKTNIADGLNAIVICIEMVFFAGLMFWAYPVTEYQAITTENEGQCTSPWKAFGQALNFWDFITETWRGVIFLVKWFRTKKETEKNNANETEDQSQDYSTNLDIYAAFNGPRHRESLYTVKSETTHLENAEKPVTVLMSRQSVVSSRESSLLDQSDIVKEQEYGTQRESVDFTPRNARNTPLEQRSMPSEPLRPEYHVHHLRRDSSMLARTAPGAPPLLRQINQHEYAQQQQHDQQQQQYQQQQQQQQYQQQQQHYQQQHYQQQQKQQQQHYEQQYYQQQRHAQSPQHQDIVNSGYATQYLAEHDLPPALTMTEQTRLAPVKLERIVEVPSSQEREKAISRPSQMSPAHYTADFVDLYSSQSGIDSPRNRCSRHADAPGMLPSTPPPSLIPRPSIPDGQDDAHRASDAVQAHLRTEEPEESIEKPQRPSSVPTEPHTNVHKPPVRAETSILHEPLTFSPLQW